MKAPEMNACGEAAEGGYTAAIQNLGYSPSVNKCGLDILEKIDARYVAAEIMVAVGLLLLSHGLQQRFASSRLPARKRH
jgi:hypothetical protein